MPLSVMIYSFSSAIRAGKMSVPDVCQFLRNECDITAVEMMHRDVEPMGVQELLRQLDDMGTHVVCYISSVDLVQKTETDQEPAIDTAKSAIDNCVAMRCNLMLATTGGCKPDIDQQEARKRISAGLHKIVPYAKAAGITFTIESMGVPGMPYGTSKDLLEICERVGPDLRLTYDNGNLFTQGEDPNAALDAIWHKVVHVHCKDWRNLPQDSSQGFVGADGNRYVGEVCGEGELDYPANIAAIKRHGYAGYVSLEYEGPGDPKEAVRKGLANIRALVGEGERSKG